MGEPSAPSIPPVTLEAVHERIVQLTGAIATLSTEVAGLRAEQRRRLVALFLGGFLGGAGVQLLFRVFS